VTRSCACRTPLKGEGYTVSGLIGNSMCILEVKKHPNMEAVPEGSFDEAFCGYGCLIRFVGIALGKLAGITTAGKAEVRTKTEEEGNDAN